MTVDITDLCATATIYPTTPSDTTYITSDPYQDLTYLAWTASPSFCIYFDYAIYLNDFVTFPAFTTFFNNTKTIRVYTTDIN